MEGGGVLFYDGSESETSSAKDAKIKKNKRVLVSSS